MPQTNANVINHLLTENQSIPNNETLPLLIYPQAVDLTAGGSSDPAAVFEQLFAQNAWQDSWRNGVFSYHHYHSKAHEVLGCYRGTATIQFGGEAGVVELPSKSFGDS